MYPMQSESRLKVWLSHRAAEQIRLNAAKYFPLETGGVLLGWRNGPNRTIVDVIGAGPNALHGRMRFLPDHPWQMHHIREAFRSTSGDLDYIGDWHTHPDGIARMSAEDTITLRKISQKVKDPAMLIAAGNLSAGWHLEAWLQPTSKWLAREPAHGTDLQIFTPPEDWPNYNSGTEELGT